MTGPDSHAQALAQAGQKHTGRASAGAHKRFWGHVGRAQDLAKALQKLNQSTT